MKKLLVLVCLLLVSCGGSSNIPVSNGIRSTGNEANRKYVVKDPFGGRDIIVTGLDMFWVEGACNSDANTKKYKDVRRRDAYITLSSREHGVTFMTVISGVRYWASFPKLTGDYIPNYEMSMRLYIVNNGKMSEIKKYFCNKEKQWVSVMLGNPDNIGCIDCADRGLGHGPLWLLSPGEYALVCQMYAESVVKEVTFTIRVLN